MSAASDLRPDPRIELECIRTLYRQLPNSFLAATGLALCMAVTLGPFLSLRTLGLWIGLQVALQLLRFLLYQRYRAAELTIDNAGIWARRCSQYMMISGLGWGSSVFLFLRPEQPITEVLTLCGLYGICGGAVPGYSYHPPALYGFVGVIFGAITLRMIEIGGGPHTGIAAASLLFAVIMVLFCREQHRTVTDAFRVRFENEALVEELRHQKFEADSARFRAEQANLAKSQFLAAASHDLRQPLHALGLFSASLKGLTLDAEGEEVVARIHDNVGALETLFDALLDISRLDAGTVRPAPESIDIGTLLARLGQYFEVPAREKSLRLVFVSHGERVHADPMLLERILSNLIANAIRYTEQGGVLVGCRRRGEKLSIEVWDTGIGIALADRQKIFQEFIQLGNPERDRRKGMGLGLAIAQRTASLIGTAITLDSHPGRGSVFRIVLPLTDAPLTAPAAPAEAGLDRVAGLRILIIDDEQSIRDALSRLLRQWGAEVTAAPSLDEALAERAAGRHWQIVLADFRLRGRHDGIEVIETIAAAQQPPPVACLITGDMNADLLAEARRRGLPLLHKPVRPAQLRAVLNHLATDKVSA
ncbi:MAG TPA: hybrid sensor histidine kinase/response regulator [Aliidongia sp.]|nr:hybrid sensor histidine kinase/response regulator [Aliidongia sp.]